MKTVNQYLKNKTQYDKEMETQKNRKNKIRTVREVAQENGIELGNLTSEKSTKGFFKDSKAFENGYQIGDITKTTLATGADLLTDIGEGFLSASEGVADWGQYRVSDVLNLIGAKNASEAVKKNAQFNSTAAIFGKNEKKEDNFFKDWTKGIEENSISGDTLDTVFQGVGQVGAMAGMAYLGGGGAEVGTTATKLQKAGSLAKTAFVSYTSAYGNARSEAYKNGADDSTANKAGVIGGFSEAIAEQFFNGLPGYKSAGWFDKLNGKIGGKLEKTLGSKIGRTFLKLSDTMGEGAEEMISNALNSLGTDIAHYIGTKTGKEYNYGMENLSGHALKDMANSFVSEDSISSFFSAALTSALIGGGNTFLSNSQKNTILKEYAKENNITLKQAEQQLNATIESQTPNLPFEEKVEQQEKIQKQELDNMKKGTFMPQEINESNLPMDKKNQRFIHDSSKITDEFEKKVYESAAKVLNNTNETHKFVEQVAKIAKDKNTNYGFINNEELKALGQNLEGKEVGGFVKIDENGQKQVLINIDSPRALNSIVGHETTHLLEGTIEYQELQNSIFEYAKQKGDFDERQKTLIDLYKDIKDADINSEMTADLVGDYLFTDEKFINELSTKKPTIFQKIKDLIDDLVTKFTGTKEEKMLRNVQKKFKEAYEQNGNIESNKYMMISKNGVKEGIKNNSRYNDIKNKYFEAIKMEQNNIFNEEIRQKTGWFKDNKGNWEFEISDENTNFKEQPITDKVYKLSDIFEASTLYDLYPDLKDATIEFKKMKNLGNFSSDSNKITLNKKLLSDLESARGTLLHEIQHYIQRKENLPTGTTIKFGNEHYANSKGEIEAADTKRRMNLTVEQRKKIIPESAKENPVHPNREAILNYKRNVVDKIIEKIYNKYGDKIDEVAQEDFLEDIRKTSDSIVETYIEDGRIDEELNNSSFYNEQNQIKYSIGKDVENTSFSLDENCKRYEELLQTNNIEYFKKDNGDIRINMLDSNYGLVNQLDLWSEADAIKQFGEQLGTKLYNEAEDVGKTIYIGNKNNDSSNNYMMSHRPTETGAYASDITNNGELMPEDVYEHPEYYYQMKNKYSQESMNVIKKIRGNPNAEITIYRATPGNSINAGDWITLSKTYAKFHNDSQFNGKANILEMKVKAKDIQFAGDDINEFGYFPQSVNYSLSNNDTDITSKGKYNVYGDDIKYQESEQLNLPTNGILTDKDYQDKEKELLNKFSERISKKVEKQTNEIAKRNLELKKQDTQELKTLIDNYKDMTREEIFNSDAKTKINEFVRNHSGQEFQEEVFDNELNNLQREIKNTKFIIDEKYKGEFPDGIIAFKKSHPGLNIVFGKKSNIDSKYQELVEGYKGRLSEEATTGDIPYILADILSENTKMSNTISYELNDKEIEQITNKIYFGLTNNSITKQNLENYISSIQDKIQNKYARQMAIQKYRELAREQIGDITEIKDKKRGLSYQINTQKRNLRDIMSPKQAQEMYNTYFKPISENNAKLEIDKQSYVDRIQKFNLTNEESTYTQMLGEKKYNPETTVTQEQLTKYLEKNYKKIDTEKVNNAIEEFRNIYDELIVRINDTYLANGYKPIEYRKGYFPHFIEEKTTSILGKFAEKLGWKVNGGELPTDIAGITEEFSPGRAWTSFSQRRTGDATDYNALKGLDNYLNGAMDVIHHTEDIQKLRALENEIRYQYSDKGIQQKIDEIFEDNELSAEEKYMQIASFTDHMKNNGLGNFASELRSYTNNLANKKAIQDRGMEQDLGRDTYSIMNNINSRVSANMVGANISSALTNFIPITQAWSQVKTKNLMKGITQSIRAVIKDDGFSDNSVYLINRTQQADKLYKTKIDKINDKLGIPFEAIDSFTSNTIVRAKYLDNIEKGMSEIAAMENADEYAKDIMGGRSKGDNPTIFNRKNPVMKLFTAFQLEVNNQYGYMFKDIKADLADEGKDKLAAAFFKMFLGAWIYNFFAEKITGRKSAFSPIDMVIDDIKTATNENMDLGEKISSIATNKAKELPFVGGIMGGGRLPIQGAIPYENPLKMITSTIEDASDLFDEEKRDTAIKNIVKEWQKPVYYLGMPFGGGQLKKTVDGLSMYDDNLPVAGSYTNSGKLRFEADDSILGKMQAAVFGQYASKNAREYFDKGYQPLTEKQIGEVLDSGMSVNEYREYRSGLSEQETTEDKVGYIYNLPLENNQKNVLVNNVLNRKENVDISNYGDYGSLSEFDYANKNPNKYSTIKQITDYGSFLNYKKEIENIKDQYSDTNSKKYAIRQYINSLNLNKYQKMMLEKMGAGYSIKSYQSEIREYIEGLSLTKEEKQAIDKELFG